MKKTIFFNQAAICVLFTCLAVFAVGCQSVKTKAPPFKWFEGVDANVYYPLREGASWNYQVEEIGPDGASQSSTLLVRVIKRFGADVTLQTGGDVLNYRIQPGGIQRIPSGNYLIREPIAPNTSWQMKIGDVTGTATITSVDETTVTHAGEFVSCIVIEENYPENETSGLRVISSYAPNVGLVQMDTLIYIGKEEMVQSRVSLRIYQQPGNKPSSVFRPQQISTLDEDLPLSGGFPDLLTLYNGIERREVAIR